MQKMFDLFDGDHYMGQYDARGIQDVTGIKRHNVYKATGGGFVFMGRWTIQDAGSDGLWRLHKEPINGFPEEWAAVTAVIRDVIATERRILEAWEPAAAPLRRTRRGIWRN